MPDRTSQPPSGTGVNSRYSTAIFLWNGADADKNAIGNTSSSTGLKGTSGSSADGSYRLFGGTDAPMQWTGLTLPASTFTVAVAGVFPTGSIGSFSQLIACSGGGGFRLETQTTGGGVYHRWVNTGSAAASNTFIDSVSSFDGRMWVYIAAYDGTNLRQYRKTSATADTPNSSSQVTETLTYSAPSGSTLNIGDTVVGSGMFAAIVVPSDIGDTECNIILSNPWAMFAQTGGGGALSGSALASGIGTSPPSISVGL